MDTTYGAVAFLWLLNAVWPEVAHPPPARAALPPGATTGRPDPALESTSRFGVCLLAARGLAVVSHHRLRVGAAFEVHCARASMLMLAPIRAPPSAC